jgi:hypothetical protein
MILGTTLSELALLVLFAVGLIASGRGLLFKGPPLYSWAARTIGTYLTHLIIGAVVVFLGIAAHWFKGKNQRWYGMVEVLFGSISGFGIALNISPRNSWLTQGAALVGCAYVIARGLNNIADAKKVAARRVTV